MRSSWFWQKKWTLPGSRKPSRWQPKGWYMYRGNMPNGCCLHLTRCNRLGMYLSGITDPRGNFIPPSVPNLLERSMKRRTVAAADDNNRPRHLAPMETEFFARLLALAETVACTAYDDGSARKPGWWTLRTIGSAWQIEIKDPDTASRLVVTGATLDEVLMLADTLLRADEAPWEPDAWLKQKATPKGKK